MTSYRGVSAIGGGVIRGAQTTKEWVSNKKSSYSASIKRNFSTKKG